MNLRDAAQQALDALERYQVKRQDFDRFADVIIVLRAALAEPEQIEPVKPYCYIYEYDQGFGLHREFHPIPYNGMKPSRTVPIYAAPPKQEQAEPVAPVYSATPFCPTCESLARAVMTDQVLYDAIVKNELLRDDAARWRWARKRLETRMLETMRGKLKLALNVRVGWSFFETTGDPGRGYIRREQYEQDCCYLDEQVDEAIKRANARRDSSGEN